MYNSEKLNNNKSAPAVRRVSDTVKKIKHTRQKYKGWYFVKNY